MSHLNLETLARLVDDVADPTEAGHLDICEPCRRELEALRADAVALRNLPDPQPPVAAWLSLEQTLQREGLMRRNPWVTQLLRLAAVLVIFVLGSLAGAFLVQRQTARVAAHAPTMAAPVRMVAQQPVQLDSEPSAVAALTMNAQHNAATVVNTGPAATAEEAVARLRDAERAYLSALTRYSEFGSKAETGDPVARLAALESIVATTRAALGQAPADPIINGYHLTAVAQRDATLRQIAASGQTWY